MIEFLLGLATVGVSLLVSQTVGLTAFRDWFYRGGSGLKCVAINLAGFAAVPVAAMLVVLIHGACW